MDVPGNAIGEVGATSLVEALKEMVNLDKLDLGSEYWAVANARALLDCNELEHRIDGVVTGEQWEKSECGSTKRHLSWCMDVFA